MKLGSYLWVRRETIALGLIGIVLSLALSGVLFLPGKMMLNVQGDHTHILTDAKAMFDGASLFFNRELGYPFGSDRYYFPMPDYTQRVFLALGDLITGNIFGAVYVYYLFIVGSVFLSCFASLLWLNFEARASLIVSLAYGLLPFAVYRFAGHDVLAAYYSAPLAAALALSIDRISATPFSASALRDQVRSPFIIVALFVNGFSGAYFAFFSAMLIGVAGLLVAIGRQRLMALAVGVLFSGLICILFGLSLSPYFFHHEAFPKPGFDDAFYAATRVPDILKQFDLFHIKRIMAVYNQYEHRPRLGGEGYDFWPGPILSIIVLLLAPVIAFASAQRLNTDKTKSSIANASMVVLAATLVVVGVLFSLPESYGYLFNMLVVSTIRSQARVGVYVAFFAIVILLSYFPYLASENSKKRTAAFVVLALLMAINAWTQIGYIWKFEHSWDTNPAVQTNIESIKKTLVALHESDAKIVLQLPIAGWPNIPNIGVFEPYNHFAFYIYDELHSPLRWSYGMNWVQPEFAIIRRLGDALDGGNRDLGWRKARCMGFDTVVIEKIAYSPGDLSALVKSLVTDFPVQKPLFDDNLRAAYSLTSVPKDDQICVEQGFPEKK